MTKPPDAARSSFVEARRSRWRRRPRELLEFLRRHDAPIKNLALGLRGVVLDEMAPCHEYIFAMRSAVMLLFGPTDRVIEDCVCMIGVLRKHVNLQFTDGVELEDPYGVLRGAGKRMRHITLKTTSELDRPEIRALLQQARKHAGMMPRRGTGRDVVTRVKPPRLRSFELRRGSPKPLA